MGPLWLFDTVHNRADDDRVVRRCPCNLSCSVVTEHCFRRVVTTMAWWFEVRPETRQRTPKTEDRGPTRLHKCC